METEIDVRIIEDAETMTQVEELQRVVWAGSETDLVPVHVLRSTVQHGGLLIGAWVGGRLAGFVYGFPGFYQTPDGPRLEHYSHLLGVHPDFRNAGIGFRLKRAQWQMVRQQGIDRITWTYDPLLSRNAWLNITRLGAVCNTYLPNFYGAMRDELNLGVASDRFQVDWWVNTKRVNHRLSRGARDPLELDHYLTGEVKIINPGRYTTDGSLEASEWKGYHAQELDTFLLVEIPVNFLGLKAINPYLAGRWRMQTRQIFQELFTLGYLVTDFVHQTGEIAHSYYVLCHGESTL
jgi:predicted GNAT superfamily acetyltransferase